MSAEFKSPYILSLYVHMHLCCNSLPIMPAHLAIHGCLPFLPALSPWVLYGWCSKKIYIYKNPLLSSSSLYNNIYICAQDWWQAKKLATGELGYIPTGFIQPVQNTNETGKRSAPPPPKATAAAAAVAPQPAFVVRNHSLFY